MTHHGNVRILRSFAAALTLMLAWPALAGSIDLVWDASAGATGYRLYRGSASGTYGAPTQVGSTSQTTLGAAADCVTTFYAVSAYNSAGESPHSNELASWPRPVLTDATDQEVRRGERVNLIISGVNFEPGAGVVFSNPAIILHTAAIDSCNQITADITVGTSAAYGPVGVTVTNLSGIEGSASALFSVIGDPLPQVPNLQRTDKQ